MGQKRWNWQTWTGAGLLFLMCMTIFMPGLSFSADKYMDCAVEANRYALRQNPDLNVAQSVIENYRNGGAKREDFRQTCNRKIRELTKGDDSISRLFLARWVIRVKNHVDLEGIELQEGRSLRNTDIYFGLRLWGWLTYIPFLMNLITLIFVLSKGRPFKGMLLADGITTILCESICHFAVPSMLWSEGGYVVRSFALVGEETLGISGTGAEFVKSLLRKSGGISWILVIVAALLLIIYSSVTLIICQDGKKDIGEGGINKRAANLSMTQLEVWNSGKDQKKGTQTKKNGEIYCINGEYAGQSIPVNFGEEIIFGRDSRYCMLIFSNPKVSRKHCGVRYDTDRGCYLVIDYSSGGTMLADGSVLAASEYTALTPGTEIYMAGRTEVFMLM